MSKKKRRPHVAAILKLLKDPSVETELQDLDSEERYALLRAVADALRSPVYKRNWKPSERWRERRPDETARQFLERVYMDLPYEDRPYTHELGDATNGDPALYAATNMLVTNNRRLGRRGEPGSIDAARSLEDLFPMIGGKNGPKQKDLPDEFDAILYVAKRRAQAAQRLSAAKNDEAPAAATRKKAKPAAREERAARGVAARRN